MPTFSRSLEQALHRALSLASERNHELATLEHLLLALIDDRDAAAAQTQPVRDVLVAIYQHYPEREVLKSKMPGHVGLISMAIDGRLTEDEAMPHQSLHFLSVARHRDFTGHLAAKG